MDFDAQLQRIAEEYRADGYEVVFRPQADQLPAFARDFRVSLLAARGNEKALVQVKKNRGELAADPDVPRQAEVTNRHPGWRYDLVLLEGDDPLERTVRGAAEPTDEQLLLMLKRAEESRGGAVPEATLLLLWAALEATLRRQADSPSNGTRQPLQPRALLSQAYSSGQLTREEFDRLVRAWKLRTEIVHGFVAPPIDDSLIRTVIDVTRRLLEESRGALASAT